MAARPVAPVPEADSGGGKKHPSSPGLERTRAPAEIRSWSAGWRPRVRVDAATPVPAGDADPVVSRGIGLHRCVASGLARIAAIAALHQLGDGSSTPSATLQPAGESGADAAIRAAKRAAQAATRGDAAAALEHLRRAAVAARESGDVATAAEGFDNLGIIEATMNDWSAADGDFTEAGRLAELLPDTQLLAQVGVNHAEALAAQGLFAEAVRRLNGAFWICLETDRAAELGQVRLRLDRLEHRYFEALDRLESEFVKGTAAARCDGVAELVEALGRAVGCSRREVTALRIASRIYNFGKAALPDELLEKQGALTEEEWVRMRSYPADSARMARDLGFPRDVAGIIRHHHEHWDGSGYPDGLRQTQIHLTARVFCVAEAYCALMSERSFRRTFDKDEALAQVEGEAGKMFDPELVAELAFIVREIPRSSLGVPTPAWRESMGARIRAQRERRRAGTSGAQLAARPEEEDGRRAR